ncbi:MAG: purine-nucleoside phosphorylase [Anaerolineales bacterium]|jgi:purine-nucleoside phosphorylase
MDLITTADIDNTVAFIRARTSVQPEIGMILGSGLGAIADAVAADEKIATGDIPGWPVSTVHGHAGRVVVGDLEDHPVFVLQGRAHFYEGHPISQIGLPIRVMYRLGVRILIVTNAAGAVNPDFEPGDLMLISDHINLLGMTGNNPLRGPNLDEFGPRFPDMGKAYDPALGMLAKEVALEEDVPLRKGVYVCVSGPSYETTAELRFLRIIGVDAVGMSTAPEVTVARHCGMQVLGISGISNKANLDGETETTHEEVLEAGKIITPRLKTLICGVLRRI